MEEDERCDEESVVFNARISENEMIITIEEYQNMKAHIEALKKEIQESYDEAKKEHEERHQIGLKLDIVTAENTKLKRGIVNFIKGLGG